MTYELLFGLIGFVLITTVTPGPNNLMLMASGANFGILRTVPHALGVILGHGFMVIIIGLGLIRIFEIFPLAKLILSILCTLFIVYLAWKIAGMKALGEGQEKTKPLTFWQASAFQWVNPKAIYMAISSQTLYAPDGSGWLGAAYVGVVFIIFAAPNIFMWTWLGVQVKRILTTGNRLRIFNAVMALALVLLIIPIWLDYFSGS